MVGFDVFVLVLYKEVVGIVFLEVVYVGVLIVVMCVGGVLEMVVDGSNVIFI